MNRRTFGMTLLASVSALSLAAMTDVRAEPRVGQPAPTFSAVDSNGKAVKLDQYRGKTVVLEWTNDGCPYVRKHYGAGNMQALQKKWTGEGIETGLPAFSASSASSTKLRAPCRSALRAVGLSSIAPI